MSDKEKTAVERQIENVKALPHRRGKQELLTHLEGGRNLTVREAILAKCFSCCNGYSMDGEMLLSEKEVASRTGLTVSMLWRMRATGTGIPFTKLSPERTGRIRYRLEDVAAYVAANPKPAKKTKPKAPAASEARTIELVTMTCEEAAQRHQGVTRANIAHMCLLGKTLSRRHGGGSKIPAKDLARVIRAVKVGKSWAVPISELDRVFLGKQD